MFTKKRVLWTVVILVLVLSNTATYYATPYIKIVQYEYSTVFVNAEAEVVEEIPTAKLALQLAKLNKEAYIAVVVGDGLALPDAKAHREWAIQVISNKKEADWDYWRRENRLLHTAIIFKLME